MGEELLGGYSFRRLVTRLLAAFDLGYEALGDAVLSSDDVLGARISGYEHSLAEGQSSRTVGDSTGTGVFVE